MINPTAHKITAAWPIYINDLVCCRAVKLAIAIPLITIMAPIIVRALNATAAINVSMNGIRQEVVFVKIHPTLIASKSHTNIVGKIR